MAATHNPTRRLFLTGGTGFVGKTILDYLIDANSMSADSRQALPFQVDVLSRNPQRFLDHYPRYRELQWLTLVQGSLENLPLSDIHYDDVIHAAADTHLHGEDLRWIEQIVNGTRTVLDFALRHGATRFLLTSSGAIYGPQPWNLDKLREDYAGAPPTTYRHSTYGQSKRLAEQLCTIYYDQYGLETISARCFAFAGEHLPLNGPYAIGNFIRDALYGDSIRVNGDGTAVRSYLYGADMAHWLITLLCYGAAGEAYNVGADEAITIRDLAHLVARLLAPQKPVLIENLQAGSRPPSRYIPSIEKVLSLGLHSRFSLDETIMRTAQMLTRHLG